ncbi:MAG TPA: SGNH/GDSL hydrolase family protein [Oligoflexus sp.]|uniref:SGNH/GDSL hydrolase family protein n=1 Tax=Oligoflexus sp. TaxID=1971216 RepID=UPI002D429453|nr:SGNH/GDSL hydrolase family protein [Oligoflexus sp.]HYX39596.1 SGNH/GDSL hydrolase family protein [Oligoflexus sp.]
MLRIFFLLMIQIGAAACQSPQLPAKAMVTTAPWLDKGPRVDEGVRAHQNQWLKGLVLDPDQTGVTTLVVLGDSYSDTGNLFQRTQTLGPPQVFWRSRFSNGPIWVDYVQGATGWTIRNYAFTDIEEGEGLATIPATSVPQQIEQLKRDTKNMNRAEMLVVLWIGPDFYRGESDRDAIQEALGELRKALIALDSLGFHRIAVGNLPDPSQQPLALSPKVPVAQRAFWKGVAAEHNAGLGLLLEELKKTRLDLRAYLYQTYEMQKISQEKAESTGVVLKKEACFNGDARGQVEGIRRFCRQPGSTPYWDATHPSSKLHCFYAAQFLADTADAEHVGGYNKGQAVDHCQQL